MRQVLREAALRPAAAELYPFLPAPMWTAAAYLTELAARYRGICAKAAYRSNKEKQLSGRRIAVLRAPTAGVQKSPCQIT